MKLTPMNRLIRNGLTRNVVTFGVMAIAGLTSAVVIACHPVMVQAQTTGGMEQWSQVLEQLNLTPEQQTQLNQIRTNTQSQLEILLTPQQREQFKTSLENGSGLQDAIAAMNLSPDQQTQLQSLFESARAEASAVLTEEQQQQVREIIRSQLEQRQ